MNVKQQETFLRRCNEPNVSVIDTTNSYIPPANLFISLSETGILHPLLQFWMKGLILLVIFFKIRRLLFNVQDQKDIQQNPNQILPSHITLN